MVTTALMPSFAFADFTSSVAATDLVISSNPVFAAVSVATASHSVVATYCLHSLPAY